MIPPTGTKLTNNTIGDQTSSLFFKLPLEVRIIIYQYVLGGRTIHFAWSPRGNPPLVYCICPFQGRRSHLLCRDKTKKTYCHRASLADGQGWQLTEEVQEQHLPSCLPLLLTSQQIYSEAVTILASHNVFNIQAQIADQLQAIIRMRALLPEQMFHAIRTLEISFCLSNLEPQIHDLANPTWFKHWTQMCATVRDMQGLLSLHIWVNVDQDAPAGKVLTADHEAEIFNPLIGGKWLRLKYFQVEVSWPATAASDSLLQNAPFTLVRMENAESPFLIVMPTVYANVTDRF